MVKLAEKIRAFWNFLNLREKLLALYILSFINTRAYPFVLGAKKIFYADIIFVFLAAAFLWRVIKDKRKGLGIFLWRPIIVMTALFAVSFFNSVNLKDSFFELSGLVYLIALFLLVPWIITSRPKLNAFLYLWLFTATLISIIGLSAFFAAMINRELMRGPFLFYTTIESMAHHFPRIHSTFNNANMLCTYLHVSLVFSFILLLSESAKKKKNIIIICMLILFLTAFFTGSRRFTGLLLSVFLILTWYGKSRISRMLRTGVFWGFILFLAASVITSIWVIFPVSIIKDNTGKAVGLDIEDSYSLHFVQPAVSVNMIKEHPFIGVGFGTYNKHFRDYLDWEWVKAKFSFKAYPESIKFVEDRTLNFDPHSAFLGVLAETGIVGFSGMLYFLVSYSTVLFKKTKLFPRDSYNGISANCIFSGFIGFLLIGLFTDILSMRHFWFLMAVGISTQNLPEKQKA